MLRHGNAYLYTQVAAYHVIRRMAMVMTGDFLEILMKAPH